MKNVPQKIYLQHGEIDPDDFNELSIKDITWSTDQINSDDIEYVHDQFKPDTLVKEPTEDEVLLDRFINLFIGFIETKNVDKREILIDMYKWLTTRITGEEPTINNK